MVGDLPRVRFEVADIADWPSFHDACLGKLGFFSGYGRNQNAWFDCMSDAGMQTGAFGHRPEVPCALFELPSRDELSGAPVEIIDFVCDALPEVNRYRLEEGQSPLIVLAAYEVGSLS